MNQQDFQARGIRELLWAIYSRQAVIEGSMTRLSAMIQRLVTMESVQMATADEFRQALADLKAEVARDIDQQVSAAKILHAIADHTTSAAAGATDLDEFKKTVTDMMSSLRAEADDLGAAVAAQPADGGTPATTGAVSSTGTSSGAGAVSAPNPPSGGTDTSGTSAPGDTTATSGDGSSANTAAP